MDQFTDLSQSTLARQLRERLVTLADAHRDPGKQGEQTIGSEVVTYCTLTRERVAGLRVEAPLIGVVLSGAKEIWFGEICHQLYPGDAFILPAKLPITVVNVPDERSGRYESLLMQIAEPPAQMVRLALPRRAGLVQVRLCLTEELVEALAHAATIRANSPDLIANHRLTEILMLIAGQPAAARLFDASAASAAAGIVLTDPSRSWTASEIGAQLGVGGSTLRRRLDREGTSLRVVLRDVRLEVARQLLAGGAYSVAQAADAAGYVSRSHFARAFRQAYGVTPRNAAPATGPTGIGSARPV
jgi:AraC-like DNA-binding protein